MVDVTIGQQHRFQRQIPQAGRVQGRSPGKFVADVGGGVQDLPVMARGAKGDGGLGLRGNVTAPCQIAVFTTAVPLWQAAAGGSAKDMCAERHLKGARAHHVSTTGRRQRYQRCQGRTC